MRTLLLALSLVSAVAFADHHEENFDKMKENISSHIDKKISLLQSHKSCVQGASSKDALQACRKSHKDSMKQLHKERKDKMHEFKKEMKEKRKEKKDKKDK